MFIVGGSCWWLVIKIIFPKESKENTQHETPHWECGDGHMGVSKNNGTSKSSILIGFSIVKHPFWWFSPYFWKHPYHQLVSLRILVLFSTFLARVLGAKLAIASRSNRHRVGMEKWSTFFLVAQNTTWAVIISPRLVGLDKGMKYLLPSWTLTCRFLAGSILKPMKQMWFVWWKLVFRNHNCSVDWKRLENTGAPCM